MGAESLSMINIFCFFICMVGGESLSKTFIKIEYAFYLHSVEGGGWWGRASLSFISIFGFIC